MKINNISYLLIGGALALASCSHDEYTGQDVAGGKLAVIGTINQINSRANNADWEPGDAIGISSDANHDNVHFSTENGDGVFSATSTPIYVLGAGETTFTAYYPHHEAASASTPELSFTEPIDFMHASAKATRENPVANFVFSHKMSKISFDIKDNTVTSGGGSIKLDGVVTEGKFHTLTGDVTAGSSKTSVSKDFQINSAVGFILPPLNAGTGTLTVTVNYQGKVFAGNVSVSKLQPGTEYHYTIELGNADPSTQLNISSATITDWDKNDGGNVDMDEKEAEREENILEVGDFLLVDGTTLDRNDATLSQYKDKIVGVVYYVGNPQPSFINNKYDESIDVLKKDAPKAVNGLAVAINNANSNTTARFASAKYTFSDWEGAESYITSTLNLTKISTEFLGYNNTQLIKAATNELGGSSTAGETGCDAVITILDEYNSNYAINNASTWYIPSFGELNCIASEYSKISSAIKAAGGSLDQFNDFDATVNTNTDTFYWSSDFRGSTYNWVSPMVYQETVQAGLYPARNTNSNKGYFRLCIAF